MQLLSKCGAKWHLASPGIKDNIEVNLRSPADEALNNSLSSGAFVQRHKYLQLLTTAGGTHVESVGVL